MIISQPKTSFLGVVFDVDHDFEGPRAPRAHLDTVLTKSVTPPGHPPYAREGLRTACRYAAGLSSAHAGHVRACSATRLSTRHTGLPLALRRRTISIISTSTPSVLQHHQYQQRASALEAEAATMHCHVMNAHAPLTGGVCSEQRVRGTSWSALTLEAGKSPDEVARGRHVPMPPRQAISEFASPSSCSWSLNYALLETSADKVVHHQGARARRAPQSTY